MRDNFKIALNMVKVKKVFKMEIFMKVNTLKENLMVKENIFGIIKIDIEVNGEMD